VDLSDDEIEILHELLIEALVYDSPGRFDNEQKRTMDGLLDKVTNEAKERKFWWA
jgi:hypothetical protein